MTMVNRQLLLSTRPQGLVEDSTVKLYEQDVPELADGQVLVQVELISIDPATRPWMDEAEGGYLPPMALGDVVRSAQHRPAPARRGPDPAGTNAAALADRDPPPGRKAGGARSGAPATSTPRREIDVTATI